MIILYWLIPLKMIKSIDNKTLGKHYQVFEELIVLVLLFLFEILRAVTPTTKSLYNEDKSRSCCIATYNCTYIYIYKYMRKQSTDNDDFNNERIHFLIKI